MGCTAFAGFREDDAEHERVDVGRTHRGNGKIGKRIICRLAGVRLVGRYKLIDGFFQICHLLRRCRKFGPELPIDRIDRFTGLLGYGEAIASFKRAARQCELFLLI